MSIFMKNYRAGGFAPVYNLKLWRLNSSTTDTKLKKDEEEEFRVLDIVKSRQKLQRKVARRTDIQPDRVDRMPTDQNWGNVWPGPKSFHPSSVPLPVRQGYVLRGQAPPGKKANAELMKIPNFLHLTPPVIKRQCEALKQYCTEWPRLLNSEETIEKHYPVEIITSDYCHASPCIRNPLARIVTLRVKLSTLNLDSHARDKFLRLVSERYDQKTDLVTIMAERCPVRSQNLDYVNYLLTACFHESWNVEGWEKEKSEIDMEYYDWDNNASKRALVDWHLKCSNDNRTLTTEEYKNFDISVIPNTAEYKNAVFELFNSGENEESVENYGKAVRKLLGLPDKKVV